MEGQDHPAWWTAIIPYIDDRRMLDQLWCASKSFQHHILNVDNVVCTIFPTTTYTSRLGIYPRYMDRMPNLRHITVQFHPGWNYKDHSVYHSDVKYHEVFSDIKLPSQQIIRLDIDRAICNKLVWGITVDSFRLNWLHQLIKEHPNIVLGPQLKRYVADMIQDLPIPELKVEHTETLLQGGHIGSLSTTVLSDIIERYKGSPDALSDKLALITELVNDVPVDINTISMIYSMLPRLTRVVGDVPFLSEQVQSYVLNEPVKMPHLPGTVKELNITYRCPNIPELILPSSLTSIRLKTYHLSNGIHIITPQQFSAIISALPSSLITLMLENPSDKDWRFFSKTSLYWPARVVARLPRGLRTLHCEGLYIIGKDYYNDPSICELLPPSLTDMSLHRNGLSLNMDLVTLLPIHLTSIDIFLSKVKDIGNLSKALDRFDNLRELTLQISIKNIRRHKFPQIPLPTSLLRFAIIVPIDVSWKIPLHAFVWPLQLEELVITTQSSLICIKRTSIPKTLIPISLTNVKIV